jgi:hypothetical protein
VLAPTLECDTHCFAGSRVVHSHLRQSGGCRLGLRRRSPASRRRHDPSAANRLAAQLRSLLSAKEVQNCPREDDTIVIKLVEPADMPAVVRIVWPSAPTITTAAKLNEVAAEAMKILAYASTR